VGVQSGFQQWDGINELEDDNNNRKLDGFMTQVRFLYFVLDSDLVRDIDAERWESLNGHSLSSCLSHVSNKE